MSKVITMIGLMAMMGCILNVVAAPVYAADLSLASTLVEKLGVTTEQAEGGAGSIFNVVSNRLSADDFSKVTDALPEVSSLLSSSSSDSSSSSSGSSSSALGGLTSLMGKSSSTSNLTSVASLASTFSDFGLGSDMVSKFSSVILEYAESKGGSEIASLIGSVLK
ncbi:DUF2780 domain-containing protein [Desulfosarcina ovata]|uniref:DUF2780 domain-containing protein n=2 Tax=Desulfosarcina ovata TaxID=83564 RepID=A0A5K8AJZ8_9BACT|nr:DUF2780 domain-containing protein [Desulfosarcina ovata]BBO85819.1 hypothetical protein DSCO28_63850 [Desulfosarcina ovata subsp. sediminis]BBO92829.1 hypothetical protein DSCOOX_60090 [Desulfosarcina ovata subsp. ovata]